MPIEIQGIESIQKKLKPLDDALSPSKMRSTLLTVGNMVKNTISESFENESSPFGSKWQPLKINTAKAKAKRGASSKILRDEGNLADRWLVSVEDDGVSISNNIQSKGYAYGKAHQFGTKHMPKRPFLPIDDNGNLEPRLLKTIDSYLENKIGQLLK
jgi:phage virion morphogenesis protein